MNPPGMSHSCPSCKGAGLTKCQTCHGFRDPNLVGSFDTRTLIHCAKVAQGLILDALETGTPYTLQVITEVMGGSAEPKKAYDYAPLHVNGAPSIVVDLLRDGRLTDACCDAIELLGRKGAFHGFGVLPATIMTHNAATGPLVGMLVTSHGPRGRVLIDPESGWDPDEREALWVLLAWLGFKRVPPPPESDEQKLHELVFKPLYPGYGEFDVPASTPTPETLGTIAAILAQPPTPFLVEISREVSSPPTMASEELTDPAWRTLTITTPTAESASVLRNGVQFHVYGNTLASSVYQLDLDYISEMAKEVGVKRVNLHVPENSPSAQYTVEFVRGRLNPWRPDFTGRLDGVGLGPLDLRVAVLTVPMNIAGRIPFSNVWSYSLGRKTRAFDVHVTRDFRVLWGVRGLDTVLRRMREYLGGKGEE